MTRLTTSARSFNWRRASPFALGAALVGVVVVIFASAAGPLAAFEPETGMLAGSAATPAVTGASGGKVVQFAVATPTPAPSSATCQGAANSPGGSDGFGTCWPAAYNTGYPHGLAGDTRTPVTLTTYTGTTDISQTTTIDSKTINGGLDILPNSATTAYTVTIKNSRIIGSIFIRNWEGPVTVIISDTEIGPNAYADNDLISAGSFSCTRCNLHTTTADGFKFNNGIATSGVIVVDSYLHDFKYTDGAHNDGAQTTGINHAVIRHNTFDGADPAGGTGLTSGIMLGNENDNINDVTIDKNYFAGIGNYALYGGHNQGTGYQPTNTSFTNNRFLKGSLGGSGMAVSTFVAPNSVWAGNAYTTGEVIPK